jgi:hypothetical protein
MAALSSTSVAVLRCELIFCELAVPLDGWLALPKLRAWASNSWTAIERLTCTLVWRGKGKA